MSLLLEDPDPFRRRLFDELRGQDRGEFRLVLRPEVVVLETGIVDQVLPVQDAAELRPEHIVSRRDDDPGILCPEGLEGGDRGVRPAERSGDLSRDRVAGDGALQDGEEAVHHRAVVELSAAGLLPVGQGGENADRGLLAGDDVADGGAHPAGGPPTGPVMLIRPL